jgi:hypothetical protein
MVNAPDSAPAPPASSTLRPLARLLLWDYDRGSPAYDLALVVVILILLLVPGGYWGDPLWPTR